MPPRHGKSLTATQLFSAYYLYRNPSKNVGIVGYNADFVSDHSEEARRFFRRSDGSISKSTKAKTDWKTDKNGGFFGTSVGGSITGKGFDLAIIDDPIKGIEDAFSRTKRESLREWFSSDFYTRLEPNASVIVIHTRWHRKDLAGTLLQQEREADRPEGWRIVSFPALKEENEIDYPDGCNVVRTDREAGEALCPERYDVEDLKQIKGTQGAYKWNALYQQRPAPESGNIWKEDLFGMRKPDSVELVDTGLHVDAAYTENEQNSASAWVKAAKDRSGNVYVLDVGFDWLELPELLQSISRYDCPIMIENKASGKSLVQALTRNGLPAEEVDVQGDKVARAKIAKMSVNDKNIFVHPDCYSTLLLDKKQGILEFPNGQHDDLADAFSQAIEHLSEDEENSKQTKGGFKMNRPFF
ncbi:terminase large subunit domain-containing protein [Salinibacter grassmerensis]|uniref:terminase large subunit domain-containing protein n=1 Tax=Salinibacter grassmerensis TaxID=3040353 RepID=UPI0021E74D1F|nr:terminase family protein [Salinibacter grassmerensis]